MMFYSHANKFILTRAFALSLVLKVSVFETQPICALAWIANLYTESRNCVRSCIRSTISMASINLELKDTQEQDHRSI